MFFGKYCDLSLNEQGKRIQEGEVESNPDAIDQFFAKKGLEIGQIGLERGNLTH
jgi:hypothetical protein